MSRCLQTGWLSAIARSPSTKSGRAAPFPWPPLKQPDPSVRVSDFLGLRVINSCRPSFGSVIDAYVVAPTHRSAHGDRYRSHSVPRTRAATRRAGACARTARASRRDGCGPLAVSRPRRLGNRLAADETPMYGFHHAWRGWDVMLHELVFAQFLYEPGDFHRYWRLQHASGRQRQLGNADGQAPGGRRPRRAARHAQCRAVDDTRVRIFESAGDRRDVRG